ncbi:MAG TPA: carboxypeptidase-like regulatory domain-containing protein [Tenuifilaceae bacterium]|nr:carboxypeptidase-like regulatory domain-containing protein [Tenuifilaceae bacterium]HPI44551.1 carboxypeptidase-like regulatory domain-containing protein [Tenuifilaceae bacterium]HPN22147.1 carboxypeptidase-like regulatory domain-containing protein [Tenuifilaceae bacterium]
MKKILLLFLISTLTINIKSQNSSVPPLEREVTLTISNESVPFVLNAISQQTAVVFSYSPNVISTTNKISIDVNAKSVRHTLNTIFTGTVKYKVKGKYIILQKNETLAKEDVVVEGYLYDSQTGDKLTNATVYNKEQKVSTLTDEYGYFKLEVPTDAANPELKVSKEGYADTLLSPISGNLNYVNVELSTKQKIEETPLLIEPTVEKEKNRIRMPEWLIPNRLLINTKNISDTLFSKFQFSLIPFVSTNKLLSGKTVNDYSLNMTIGYVQGVRKVELGGIANIVREDAGYCQLAGVANVVGGLAYGFQGAGTFNAVRQMSGIQAAGVINFVLNDANYIQLGGTGNFVGGKFTGVQVAGIFNIGSEMSGVQVAGVTNLTGEAEGVQVAGVLNHAKKIVGTQVAGVINNTDSLDGVQVTSVFNRAAYFKGYQIAVINYADSCDGIPFGLFNFVRKGYHKIELSADEVFYSNMAFRSGVKKFHSIVSVGIRPENLDNPVWMFGYGLGTTLGKSDKYLFDIDLTAHQVMKGSYFASRNSLYKLTLGLDRKISPKTSITFGLTYNIYVTDTNSKYYSDTFSSLVPYSFTNSTSSNGNNVKTWVGGKIGIRFL